MADDKDPISAEAIRKKAEAYLNLAWTKAMYGIKRTLRQFPVAHESTSESDFGEAGRELHRRIMMLQDSLQRGAAIPHRQPAG